MNAGTIAIFNTGVDANGLPLADQQFDPHYVLVGGTTAPYVTYSYALAFPFQVWLPDSSQSRWISPQPNYSDFRSDPPGQYDYRTTFDLTGVNPAAFSLNMRIAADDSVQVLLNGANVWQSLPQYAQLLTNFSSFFTLSSGFQPGVNTLDFLVTNNPGNFANPSGLRVEFADPPGDPASNPEPGTAWHIAAGALAAVLGRWQAARVRRL